MRLNSLPLLCHVLTQKPKKIAVFSRSYLPDLVDVIADVVVCVSPPLDVTGKPNTVVRNWLDAAFWDGEAQALLGDLRGGIAIMMCDLQDLPGRALSYLFSSGVADLVYLAYGEWYHVDGSAKLTSRLSRGYLLFFRRLADAFGESEVLVRKGLLKFFSTDLHDLGVQAYQPDDGYCYKVCFPEWRERADTAGAPRSRFLLFEESKGLLPHSSHADIRRVGGGLFAHWENDLYFSSSDNSDPNANGRRYRVIELSGLKRLFGPFLETTETDEGRILSAMRKIRPGKRIVHQLADTFENEMRRLMPDDAPRGFQLLGGSSREIVLFIGSLAAGGSERQLCYLARALKERGFEPRVCMYCHTGPNEVHYAPLLEEYGIPIEYTTSRHPDFEPRDLLSARGVDDLRLLENLPAAFADEVANLYTHFMTYRPAILHCWLDHSNLTGAIAGWLAGVPKIILSTRSVDPSNFSYIHREWYQRWYQIVATSPRVRLMANSHAGAASYAKWMGVPVNSFTVVHNGVDFGVMRYPSESEVADFRRELRLESDNQLISGIFRFTGEKRPLRFIRIIAELRKRFPQLHAAIAGTGPLQPQAEREIESLGLKGIVHLLGRRTDTARMIRASDLLVLNSTVEGLPNVLMEAQWFERPVVSTAVGGIPEVVKDGVTGYLCPANDVAAMVERCSELLLSAELRRTFGQAGKDWVRREFMLERMIEHTLAVYGSSAELSQLQAGSDRREQLKVAAN